MHRIAWIVTIPIALVAISFAVSNRELVTVALWPLPGAITAPLYLVVLLPLVLGFLAGGIVAWFAAARTRSTLRRHTARLDQLEAEVLTTKGKADGESPIPPRLPGS